VSIILPQSFTITEIKDTPRALTCVLNRMAMLRENAQDLVEGGIKRIFLIGCGSSYYAALTGAYAAINLPLEVRAIPSSELLLYYTKAISKDSAVVALSRSGRTAETLEALREAKAVGATTIALTCSEESPLEREARHSIFLDVGEERSIVMTKTFSSLSLATILLCGELARSMGLKLGDKWRPNEVPSAASEALKLEGEVKRTAGELATKKAFVFLGGGSAYPVALEGALKLMETSYVVAKAIPSLEFRHGPIAAVDEDTGLIVVATKDPSSQAMVRLVEDMRATGLSPVVASNIEGIGASIRIPWAFDERLAPPIAIIPLQLLAYYICVLKGLNPDSPRRLSKFVGRF